MNCFISSLPGSHVQIEHFPYNVYDYLHNRRVGTDIEGWCCHVSVEWHNTIWLVGKCNHFKASHYNTDGKNHNFNGTGDVQSLCSEQVDLPEERAGEQTETDGQIDSDELDWAVSVCGEWGPVRTTWIMAPVEREGDQINNSRRRERKRMKGGHRRCSSSDPPDFLSQYT